ncbi:hypothetical protein [Pseudomonas sp. DWP3-1-2]|uniref:hypothetical protein n=1 Tax=Pseudomonas sp. DWP3-1-2 TaxID=2804645 RepID=UPI003CF6673A
MSERYLHGCRCQMDAFNLTVWPKSVVAEALDNVARPKGLQPVRKVQKSRSVVKRVHYFLQMLGCAETAARLSLV